MKLFESVKEPIEFDRLSAAREEAAIEKLVKIRNSQIAYKSKYGKYASTFDSLKMFLKKDTMMVEKIIGDPNDSTVVVTKEMIPIVVLDSLFKRKTHLVDSLDKVPYTNNSKFTLESDVIVKNEIEIPAFEVGTPYTTLFKGLVPKYYKNRWYDKLAVGSIKDGTTTGNWKKK